MWEGISLPLPSRNSQHPPPPLIHTIYLCVARYGWVLIRFNLEFRDQYFENFIQIFFIYKFSYKKLRVQLNFLITLGSNATRPRSPFAFGIDGNKLE